MKSAYPMRPLGDALRRVERAVPVDAGETYSMLGVRSFGRGAFAADNLLGAETSYGKLLRVEANDIVYPKLMAWEGAFARVDDELSARHVSPEFCTFEAQAGMDPRFIGYALATPAIVELVAGSSGGTNLRRRRLYADDFLSKTIPMPDAGERSRIVKHIDLIVEAITAVSKKILKSPSHFKNISDVAIQRVLEEGLRIDWTYTSLGNVTEINPRRIKVGSEREAAFVPMRALDDVTGRIIGAEVKSASEIGKGYKQFRRGDVIFARITPCMQNGKSAVISKDLPDVGFGSTEFHVIRPRENVLAEWVHAIVRTRDFKLAAAKHLTGTAGQQRVPASFLENVQIPLPPTKEAQLQALEHIDRISAFALELRRLSTHRLALTSAVPPSALNRAFAGLA